MRLPSFLALIAMMPSAIAVDTSKMSPPAAAYYNCMMENSAKYGKKSSNAAEAIDAARSRCQKQRDVVHADTYADVKATSIRAGQEFSGFQLDTIADKTIEKIDEMMRPDLVRAVLESKGEATGPAT